MGLQIGAEGMDLVMLVMNNNGLQRLLSSKFEFSVEGSAAAGPVGRNASVGSNPNLNTQMLIYSLTKGVFVGQALEGAVIEQDSDATKAVYGSNVSFKNILLGEVPPTSSASPFLQAVTQITHQVGAEQAIAQRELVVGITELERRKLTDARSMLKTLSRIASSQGKQAAL